MCLHLPLLIGRNAPFKLAFLALCFVSQGPLMLEMGVEPRVAAATSATM